MGQGEPKQFAVTVVQGETHTEVIILEGDNLLMALVRAQYPVEFFCTTGKCTTCRLRMKIPPGSEKAPSETEQYRLGDEALKNGFRLTCQVYVTGPMTVYLSAAD